MLVLSTKKNSYINVNYDDIVLQILGYFNKGLLIKVFHNNYDGTYSVDDTYVAPEKSSVHITEDLIVKHLHGTGKDLKIGFEGKSKIGRYKKKPKLTLKKERNLDDFDFNFDTEGY